MILPEHSEHTKTPSATRKPARFLAIGPMGFLGACSKQRFRYSIVSFVAMIGLASYRRRISRLKWRTEKSRDEKNLPAFWKTSVVFCRRQIPAEEQHPLRVAALLLVEIGALALGAIDLDALVAVLDEIPGDNAFPLAVDAGLDLRADGGDRERVAAPFRRGVGGFLLIPAVLWPVLPRPDVEIAVAGVWSSTGP